jgi:hypothetical protein
MLENRNKRSVRPRSARIRAHFRTVVLHQHDVTRREDGGNFETSGSSSFRCRVSRRPNDTEISRLHLSWVLDQTGEYIGQASKKQHMMLIISCDYLQLDSVPAGVAHLLEAFQGLSATVTSTSISSNITNTDVNAAGAEALPLSLSLPEDTDMPDAVALAAVLLDYPVGYVPSREHVNILAGIPLHFYECVLKIPYPGAIGQLESGRIAFTKFSCPSEMQGAGVDGGLLPENIVAYLTELFEKRLRRSGYQNARVEIIHTVQVLDHVTF